jgi:hypothetical protein
MIAHSERRFRCGIHFLNNRLQITQVTSSSNSWHIRSQIALADLKRVICLATGNSQLAAEECVGMRRQKGSVGPTEVIVKLGHSTGPARCVPTNE